MGKPATFRDANLTPGMAVGFDYLNVSLVNDNEFIDVSQKRWAAVRITSNDSTPANRTFTISNGCVDGQVLYLHLISGSGSTCQLADSGNVALSAAWEPLQNDTLTLMWDATSTTWRELCRADN